MDLSQEIKSFRPIDLEKFSKNSDMSCKDINSIETYNKAIEYLKSGNEDIAMIELKKVVSANPNFYEAVNLLGLCYAYTKQLDKAEELFKSIVERENNAIKAADYLNFISIIDNDSYKRSNKAKNTRTDHNSNKLVKEAGRKKAIDNNDVKPETFLLKKIGSVFSKPNVAAVLNVFSVICLIVSIILFVVASRGPKQVDASSEPTTATQQKVKSDNNTTNEVKTLKEQLEAANLKINQYELSNQLSQVSTLYNQKNYVDAADKLMALKADKLTSDLKKEYDSMKDKVLSSAASQLTSEGNKLYKNKKYQEAIKKLEKVFALGDNWDFADKALYILAKSYVEVNDIQKAITTYEKLIQEYPNSAYINYAKSRLKAIQ